MIAKIQYFLGAFVFIVGTVYNIFTYDHLLSIYYCVLGIGNMVMANINVKNLGGK